MRGWTHAVAVGRNPSNRRDLRADLAPRQQAAHAGLRALTQLDFDGAYLRTFGHTLFQARHAEPAVDLAAAEVSRSDLPHEVAAVKVMRRDAAFTSVVPATRDANAAVEGLDRRSTERTEAHARDVHDRRG